MAVVLGGIGFVVGLLGRAPQVGDEIAHGGVSFRVLHTEWSRIARLEAHPLPRLRSQ